MSHVLTLRSALFSEALTRRQREDFAAALACPACWPGDRELALAAQRHGFARPAAAEPGETLLLTATKPRGGDGGLWWLGRSRPPALMQAVPFSMHEAQLAQRSTDIAHKYLPLLVLEREDVRLRALEALCVAAETASSVLRGESFGLSFFLSAASLLLGVPLPSDTVATAALGQDGMLKPVDGLDAKLRVLSNTGLGVQRLLVHASQEPEAAAILATHQARIAIVPVERSEEAFAVIFCAPLDQTAIAVTHPETQARLTDLAFRLAFFGRQRSQIPWSSVATTSQVLLDSQPDVSQQARLAFTLRTAQRHLGYAQDDRLPLELAPLTDELWKRLFPDAKPVLADRNADRYRAHFLQAATDVGSPSLEHVLTEAEQAATSQPARPSQLALLGACGRARAARRQYELAVGDLRTAVNGWSDMERPEDSSYALSELVRILGVLRRSDHINELGSYRDDVLTSTRTDPIAKQYVLLAWARALVLCSRATEALALLDDTRADWARADPHCELSRRRWQARALLSLGLHAESAAVAQQARSHSASLLDPTAAALRLLFAVDAANSAGSPMEANRLVGDLPAGAQMLVTLRDQCRADEHLATVIADEYPY